jgi:hypothetical protein
MYTEQECDEMARHFMWHRMFGKHGKGRRTNYCKNYGRPEPTNEDYCKAEDYFRYRDRNTRSATTPSPYAMEEDDMFDLNEKIAYCSPVKYDFDLLADCSSGSTCAPAKKAQKKENNMSTANINVTATTAVDTTEKDQRRYLTDRLYNVRAEKRAEAFEKFNMDTLKLKTVDEVNAALKDGTIIFDKDNASADGRIGWFCTSMLSVVNPKRDEAGYKAADALLGKAYTDAKDKIIVLPVEKGLEALNAFEAQTF